LTDEGWFGELRAFVELEGRALTEGEFVGDAKDFVEFEVTAFTEGWLVGDKDFVEGEATGVDFDSNFGTEADAFGPPGLTNF